MKGESDNEFQTAQQSQLVSSIFLKLEIIWLFLGQRDLQNDNFFICSQLMRYPLIELFLFSNLLQMLNDHRMVNFEFLDSFSCSCKRIISFDDCSELVIVNFRWLATMLLIFKALGSFAKLLEQPLYCTFISSSWAKFVVEVVSCLCCLLNCCLLNSVWTQMRKSLKFAFCLTSFLYSKINIE